MNPIFRYRKTESRREVGKLVIKKVRWGKIGIEAKR